MYQLAEIAPPMPPAGSVTTSHLTADCESGNLRQATLDDIEQIMPVHAQIAFEESGVNPLERDPEGFRRRTARRIEQGRVWVWTEGGRLIFKADVIADTPEAIYIEGVY